MKFFFFFFLDLTVGEKDLEFVTNLTRRLLHVTVINMYIYSELTFLFWLLHLSFFGVSGRGESGRNF